MLEIEPRLEITSMADIPAGTGLGSSGSFTTALLKALHASKNQIVSSRELAEQACHIEIDRLKEPIGKQDQYIAAFGGVTCFQFMPTTGLRSSRSSSAPRLCYNLEDNLLAVLHRLLPVGVGDPPRAGRQEQEARRVDGRQPPLRQGAGLPSKEALEGGDLRKFAELMNVHWEQKKQRRGA